TRLHTCRQPRPLHRCSPSPPGAGCVVPVEVDRPRHRPDRDTARRCERSGPSRNFRPQPNGTSDEGQSLYSGPGGRTLNTFAADLPDVGVTTVRIEVEVGLLHLERTEEQLQMRLYYGANTTIDLPRRCSRQWLTAIHGRGRRDRRILEAACVAAIERESSRSIHGETDSRQCHS